ncbi:hypothetical protein EV183_001016 [Coemansia sp. RSA 2336]|nr:hypothetical protein EV183_001016 [Coemansia sp. RSA 2336]
MVCTVCHESQFSAPTPPRGRGANRRGQPSSTNHPVALQCGHVFHRPCIQGWFTSSSRSECPLCHRTQTGPLLTLYVDEGTAESQASGNKSNGNKQGGKQTARKTTGSSNDMDDMYMQMLMLDVADDGFERMSLCGNMMYYQQEVEDLKETNESLEWANESLEEKLSDLGDVVETLTSDLEEANRLKETAVGEERARADRLQAEVYRLTRVSEAHKRHIRSLQVHLEDKKALLRENYIY